MYQIYVALLGLTLGALGGACAGRPPEASGTLGGTLAIAAAADLRFVLDELIADFRTDHPGVTVAPTYGSSGNFFAQIVNGAPFDLFLAADIAYPRQLAERGLTAADSLFTYAQGRLVIWVPKESALAVEDLGFESLRHPAIRHVAIANPEHAPYGKAAVAALGRAGVLDDVKPRLVLGENISQTLQFVQSRSADAGIVALSLARAPMVAAAGRYWLIPEAMHPPLDQGAAILKSTRHEAVARAFSRHLTGPRGRAVLERYGFLLPPG